jgi:type II secretory pathway pseudopilin PulG
MVVVTIIAILAALIVPALQRAQARAMTSNCMSKTVLLQTELDFPGV